jgi:hypothetical protein
MRFLSPARVVLVAVLACWATAADAQWTRHHGSECLPEQFGSIAAFAITAGGSTNTSPDYEVVLMCASDDTDEHPDSTVKEVKVYVYDASPTESVRVEACTVARDSAEMRCSPADTTSPAFVGGTFIRLSAEDLARWMNNGTDFGILRVSLPARVGPTGFSYLKGWVTEQ